MAFFDVGDEDATRNVAQRGRQNQKAKISLNGTTTFSGTDIKVFIYRDLVELQKKIKEGNFNSRDGTVTSKESTGSMASLRAIEDGRILTEIGGQSKGQKMIERDSFRKLTPTTTGDQDALDGNKPISEFQSANTGGTSGTGAGSMLAGIGVNEIVTQLGSLYALNYSSFREKNAVRTLGRTHARHYTRGQRTIAGTMTFNVLQSHELLKFGNALGGRQYTMLDQLEPFNLILLFQNEYGAMSVMHLFNVDVNTESQSMSIDDLLLTNTMNFYAQDILPIEDLGNMFSSTAAMLSASVANAEFESFLQRMKQGNLSGIASLDESLKGGSKNDTRIQKLLKRSRGLF